MMDDSPETCVTPPIRTGVGLVYGSHTLHDERRIRTSMIVSDRRPV